MVRFIGSIASDARRKRGSRVVLAGIQPSYHRAKAGLAGVWKSSSVTRFIRIRGEASASGRGARKVKVFRFSVCGGVDGKTSLTP